MLAAAVYYLAEGLGRVHVSRQGKIVDPVWSHAWIERVDRVAAECMDLIRSDPEVRRAIAGGVPGSAPLSFEDVITLHQGDAVGWMQLCVATNLYPGESWPPTAGNSKAKMIVWAKLEENARRHLGAGE